MKALFFVLFVVNSSTALANSVTYNYVGISTFGDALSGVPGDAATCACDIDLNTLNCTESSFNSADLGPICYDEYIPQGSTGHVHARVYVRSLDVPASNCTRK